MDLNTLKQFLCLVPVQWEMTPSERLAVVGLLQLLRPKSALELGHRHGGCTTWLSHFSQEVISVDFDPHVLVSCQRFPNVVPWHTTTAEALTRLQREGRHFDLGFIDADHSAHGARDDLLGMLPLADVILMHDTTNPECRSGYMEALKGTACYANLDLVEGHLQNDGLWGGLGIVLPSVQGDAQRWVSPWDSTIDMLHARYREKSAPLQQPEPAPAVASSAAPRPKASIPTFLRKRKWLRRLVRMLKGSPN
jgi:hypothetical protein